MPLLDGAVALAAVPHNGAQTALAMLAVAEGLVAEHWVPSPEAAAVGGSRAREAPMGRPGVSASTRHGAVVRCGLQDATKLGRAFASLLTTAG